MLALFLLALLISSLRNGSPVWTAFCYLVVIYSLPWLLASFEFFYFGENIYVTLSPGSYLFAIIICFLILVFIFLDTFLKGISHRNRNRLDRFSPFISNGLIIISIIAFLNNLSFWGRDLFLKGSAERWGSGLKNVNLWFTNVDYLLFFMAGSYGQYCNNVEKKRKKKSLFWLVIIVISGIVGVFIGHRYYAASLLLLWMFLPGLHEVSKRRYVYFISFTPLFLIFSANIKSFSGYILWYEFVQDKGFIQYFIDNFSIFPSELLAITTNFYIAFEKGIQSSISWLDYFVKFVPLSERFYDFSSFQDLYSQIALLGNLSLMKGQGVAFGFMLENWTSYGAPLIVLFIASVLWRIIPIPSVAFIMIIFCLNLIRNGAFIAISVLKIPILFVLMLLLVNIFYKQLLIFQKSRGRRTTRRNIQPPQLHGSLVSRRSEVKHENTPHNNRPLHRRSRTRPL